MAIKGLTDQGKKSFPRLGVIRKGAPKEKYLDAKGKEKSKIGRDLTFFRFDSPDEKANKAFTESYGKEPRMIHAVLPYRTPEENFQTCKEAHLAGGILHRCDGEMTSLIRKKDGKVSTVPEKCPGGCKEVGRLMIIIPEMLKSIHRLAYVTVLTSSKNDLVELTANLEAIYSLRGSLQTIPLVLRRVEREISCPDEKSPSGRAKRKKFMLSIEPAENFVKAFLDAAEREVLAAPTERMMLAAAPKALPAFVNPEHAIAADFQNTQQVMEPIAADFGSDIPDDEDDDDQVVCISGDILKTATYQYGVLKTKGRNGAKFTEWLKKNFDAETIDTVSESDGERLVDALTKILAQIVAEEIKATDELPPTDAPATGQSLLMDAVEGAADILSKKEIGDALELYGSRVVGKIPEEKAAEAAEYLTKKANAKRFA